jgi:hypothetical protein
MSLTRYRIGEEAGAPTVTDEMMLLTVLYDLVVGVLLTFTARRLRQGWTVFWGGKPTLVPERFTMIVVPKKSHDSATRR